jgi:hypothetical protein
LAEGDTSVFRVIEYDSENKKVILATPRQMSEEAKAVAEYKKSSRGGSGGGNAMADAFRSAGLVEGADSASEEAGDDSEA